MKHARNLLALAVAGLLATSGMAMTKEEHKAANDRISADYKAAKAKCDGLTGNAKDVCQKEAKGKGYNVEAASDVGKKIAERTIAKGIKQVMFDRGGYIYHGRIKALADAAREGGLEF